MKQTSIILTGLFILFISSCTSEESAIYNIEEQALSHSFTGPTSGPAGVLYTQFASEILEFDEDNKSDWEWIEIVYKDEYDESDARAVIKFKKALSERKAIQDKYKSQFAACADKSVSISDVFVFRLTRTVTKNRTKKQSKVISSEDIVFKYPLAE